MDKLIIFVLLLDMTLKLSFNSVFGCYSVPLIRGVHAVKHLIERHSSGRLGLRQLLPPNTRQKAADSKPGHGVGETPWIPS